MGRVRPGWVISGTSQTLKTQSHIWAVPDMDRKCLTKPIPPWNMLGRQFGQSGQAELGFVSMVWANKSLKYKHCLFGPEGAMLRAFYHLIQAWHKHQAGPNFKSKPGQNPKTWSPNQAQSRLVPGRFGPGAPYFWTFIHIHICNIIPYYIWEVDVLE